MHFWVISQFPRLRIGIYLAYSIVHGPESMPPAYASPEIRPLEPSSATAPAAPATFAWVYPQVVGREQMTVAADIGYGHGLEDPS